MTDKALDIEKISIDSSTGIVTADLSNGTVVALGSSVKQEDIQKSIINSMTDDQLSTAVSALFDSEVGDMLVKASEIRFNKQAQ